MSLSLLDTPLPFLIHPFHQGRSHLVQRGSFEPLSTENLLFIYIKIIFYLYSRCETPFDYSVCLFLQILNPLIDLASPLPFFSDTPLPSLIKFSFMYKMSYPLSDKFLPSLTNLSFMYKMSSLL